MATNKITIKDWQRGVADSPYLGFGAMRNVDIETYPGAIKAQRSVTSLFHTALSTTFTADAGTDILTIASGTMPNTGVAVTVSNSGGSLPTGLSAATNYFVIKLSSTTCKLATTIANANAGTAINITGAGSGTNTIVTVNPGSIKHIIQDKRTSTYFFQDSNAKVWYYDSGSSVLLLNGNTTTAGTGNGICLFSDTNGTATYLFAFRNSAVDVVNVFGTAQKEAPSWTNSWQTMNTGSGSPNSHHAILGQDNIVYFCDARYIGSIQENSGSNFDPSNGSTFTYNNTALDTPQNEVLNWLEELGTDILAAGDKYNFIYPWDRISSSYRLPLAVPEHSVKKLKNSGGVVYILAGTKGNIYTTQGTYVQHFKRIPGHLVDTGVDANPVTWGGIGLRNGALLVGLAGLVSGNSGVYVVYPDGRIVMDNIPHTGSGNVTAIHSETELYIMGYSGGACMVSGTGDRYSSFESVVQSQLYMVASKTEKEQFGTIELQIGRPSTGSVRIKYRTDVSSSFADFPGGAVVFTGDSVATSFESDIGLTDIENLQIQAEIAGAMEVLQIKLRP